MRKLYLFLISLIVFQYAHAYVRVGSDSTLDVLAWNIENFPKAGSTTITQVQQIVSDLDADIIAVEEIASVTDFNTVLGGLNSWDGLLSPHEYSPGDYQKVGVLYNTQKITVNNWQLLFEGDYNFPRPPLLVNVTYSEGIHHTRFNMIVMHLKAMGDSQSEERRRQAIITLKSYVDNRIAAGDSNFVMLGDLNDRLEDALPTPNVFTVMLNDPDHYRFLTQPIAGIEGSYINWSSANLIDHICITTDLVDEYGLSGSTHVQYLDNQYSSYEATVSDHRPVFSRFLFNGTVVTPVDTVSPIATVQERFTELTGTNVTIRGIITLGAGITSTRYTSAFIQDNSGAGINIYLADSVDHRLSAGTEVTIRGQLKEYNGLHEIIPSLITINSTGNTLPPAQLIETAEIVPVSDQGLRILVYGHIVSISGTSGKTLIVDDGSGPGKIYIDGDSGIDISGLGTGDSVHVSGVKSIYGSEGELLVGVREDIVKIDPTILDDNFDGQTARLTLMGNFPNPFNPRTTIRFKTDGRETVRLTIRNIAGQRVYSVTFLSNGNGMNAFNWNGVDNHNRPLSSGIYLYSIRIGNVQKTGKMLLLR